MVFGIRNIWVQILIFLLSNWAHYQEICICTDQNTDIKIFWKGETLVFTERAKSLLITDSKSYSCLIRENIWESGKIQNLNFSSILKNCLHEIMPLCYTLAFNRMLHSNTSYEIDLGKCYRLVP